MVEVVKSERDFGNRGDWPLLRQHKILMEKMVPHITSFGSLVSIKAFLQKGWLYAWKGQGEERLWGNWQGHEKDSFFGNG